MATLPAKTPSIRLDNVIDFLPDPTFGIDLDGKLIIWNRAMADITGVPASDILGKGDYEYALFFYGERRPIMIDLILERDEETIKKYPFIEQDGDSLTTEVFTPYFKQEGGVHVWAKSSLLYDSEDNVVGAIETVRDITESKKSQQAIQDLLREEKNQLSDEVMVFRQLAESTGQGIYMATLEGRIVYSNPAVANLTGWAWSETDEARSILSFYPESLHETLLQEIIPAVLAQGQWRGELRMQNQDGKIWPTLENMFVILSTDEQPKYLANIFADNSSHKRNEADMKARLAELNTLQGLLTREGWQTYQRVTPNQMFYFDDKSMQLTEVEQPEMAELDEQAWMTKDLVVKGEAVGTLRVESSEENPLSQAEEALLDSISTQIAETLDNARLLEQTHQRAIELEAVAQVSTAVSTILERQTLLQTFVDLMKRSFGLYQVHTYLFDQSTDMLDLTAATDEAGQQLIANRWQISMNHPSSLLAESARTRKGLISNDVKNNPHVADLSHRSNVKAEMCIPIVSGDIFFGVVELMADEIDFFTDDDLRIQSTLTTQIAVALQNVYLLETALQAQKDAEDRLQETQILQQLSQALTGAADVKDVINAFFEVHNEYLDFEFVIFSLVDDMQQRVKAVMGLNVTDAHIQKANHPLDSNDIMADIIRTGQTEVITGWDSRFDADVFEAENHQTWGARVFTPIKLRQKNIGLVESGFKKESSRAILDSQIRLIQAFVNQVAVAIESVQRYETSRESERRLMLLNGMSTLISQTNTLEAVLQIGVDKAQDIFKANRVSVTLLEEDAETLRVAVLTDDSQWGTVGETFPLKGTIMAHAFETRQPVVSLSATTNDPTASNNQISAMAAPLVIGGDPFGTLNVSSAEIYYSHHYESLLSQIASSLSAAIENRQLFDQMQATLSEIETLYIANRRISSSQNLQEMAAAVAETGTVSAINRLTLLLFDLDNKGEMTHLTVAGSWHSGQGPKPTPVGTRHPREVLVAANILVTPTPIFINDVQKSSHVILAAKTLFQQMEVRTMAVLPLWANAHQRGAILLQGQTVHEFTEREKQPYLALARQVAVALDNQRLLQETQAALAEGEAIQRQYTLQAWERYQASQKQAMYIHNGSGIEVSHEVELDNPQPSDLTMQLKIRGETIGLVGLQELDPERNWTSQEVQFVQAIAEQAAQAAENLRLLDETQRRAALEVTLNNLGEKVRTTQSFEAALRVTLNEIGLLLQPDWAAIRLHPSFSSFLPQTSGFVYQDGQLSPLKIAHELDTDARDFTVPLYAESRDVGQLLFQRANNALQEDEQILIEFAAEQLSQKFENLQLLKQLQQRASREQMTRRIIDEIHESRDVEAALQTAVQALARSLNMTKATIQLNVD